MTLLDETDVARRLIQHGAIVAGIVVLASAVPFADRQLGLTVALIAVGLSLILLSASVSQRWDVEYAGHRIRFVNNPLRGEHLFIDGVRVAKGQLGLRSELRATLASGETLTVIAEAGLVSFRCRMFVEPAGAPAEAGVLSDAALLAEIQRRGIKA